MARKRYSAEEIVNKLRREYGGLKTDQAKRFKQLEQENARLKKLVADLSLDKASCRTSRGETSEPAQDASCGGRAASPLPGVGKAGVQGPQAISLDAAVRAGGA